VDAVCCPKTETAADEPDSEQLQKAFPKIGIAFRHQRWPPLKMSARKWPNPTRTGSPQVKKTAKSSKRIRANKRKAKLRAKHRRRRARATGKAVMK
jgi:hypothetical protein